MYSKRSKITDIILIVLFTVIAVLLSVSGYFHFNVKQKIYEDSAFINKLGLIRGNIQRYAKFKIADIQKNEILLNIELTLNEISFRIGQEKKISDKFYLIFNEKLKKITKDFIILQSTAKKEDILKISETLWKETNNLINIALKYHKYKFEKAIKTFNTIIYLTVAFLLLIIIFVYKKIKKGLEIETITDKLTGLYNRLYFNEIYNYFIEKYTRDKKSFSMLIIDIDNFKKINDTYGHTTGDEVLSQIGKIIKETVRKTDFAFRYGGEEFVVIFPETELDEAYKVAERILTNVPQKIKVNLEPVTISGGIGEYKGENPKEFFEKIDEGLYLAKTTGKNKIIKV